MESSPTRPKALSEAEILQRVPLELPNWQFRDGQLIRDYRTSGWKSTLMVVTTIGHLAEAAWHHPDLVVTYARVRVKLVTHAAKGITEMDFALAQKIESLVQWRPALEYPGILEGTPEDPRFKYLRYD
jgi:4a-hydroxytetrahydrobiopterin dehydratase